MRKLVLFLFFIVGCKEDIEPHSQWNGLKEMQRRIAFSPSYENHINLGDQLALRGKNAEAIEAYQKAIQINPKAPLAYNNVCAEQIILGKFSEAISNCEKAIQIEPKFVKAAENLARSKVQLEQKRR